MNDIYGIYVHIPFCRNICPFCSFSVVRDNPQKHDRYLGLLRDEISLLNQSESFDLTALKTVYLGGGTPTRLSIDNLKELVYLLQANIGVDSDIQWSIEANPEDITQEYAEAIKNLGFSRVSIGIQTFSRSGLLKLGRTHTLEQSRVAVDLLKNAGFCDINFDLMFAYLGQTLQSLRKDLKEFIKLNPTHISSYSLNIEKKTVIYRKTEWQQWQSDNEVLIVDMYETMVQMLEDSGYQQYEVSNFSKVGYESLQNLCNWNGKNYLGFGMGAHSFVYPNRWGNFKRWVDYRKSLERARLPREFFETLSDIERRDEELMIGLRLNRGIDIQSYSKKYGVSAEEAWHAKIVVLKKAGLLKVGGKRLALTTKGMLLADEISAVLSSSLF